LIVKTRTLVSLAAALLLGLVFVVAARTGSQREDARAGVMKAGSFDPPQQAPEFSLRGSDGSEVTLGRYRGKVVLLTFGFTNCAAVCPTTLATLSQTRAALGKAADSVRVIFVTVDPERDTPAQLQKYLAAFDATFVGATGTPDALAPVRQAYGVSAIREGTGPNYAFAHSSSIFLIDRAGKLRAMMPYGRDAADFVNDIKILLRQ
jgi:protein SCO1/2